MRKIIDWAREKYFVWQMNHSKAAKKWLSEVVKANEIRCEESFQRYRHEGGGWMVECRDLHNSFDEDAGVFFTHCLTEKDVNDFVANHETIRMTAIPKAIYEMGCKVTFEAGYQVLGIFDLSKPYRWQPLGISSEKWKAGCRGACAYPKKKQEPQ